MNLKCEICEYTDDKSILSHIRNQHQLTAYEYKSQFPNARTRISWLDGQTKETSLCLKKLANLNRQLRREESARGEKGHASKGEKWARRHEACLQCKRTKYPHLAHGLCKRCFENDTHKEITLKKNTQLVQTGIENIDYIICRLCGQPFGNLREHGHLKFHAISVKEYSKRFPDAPTESEKSNQLRALNVSKSRLDLMKRRGYLNPQSQRDSKRKEMIRRHVTNDFSRISKTEGVFADWLRSQGIPVVMGEDLSSSDSPETFYWQYPWDKFCLDFAQPSTKKVIEVLGDWWHGWDFVIGHKKFEELHPKVQRNICLDKLRFKALE